MANRPPTLDQEPEADTALVSLVHFTRRRRRIPLKIPKSCRVGVALSLSSQIEAVLNDGNCANWLKLANLASSTIGIDTNLTLPVASQIRANLTESGSLQVKSSERLSDSYPREPRDETRQLGSAVNAKLIEGDSQSVVRVVASDASVLEITPEVLAALRLKHPDAPGDSVTIDVSPEAPTLVASEDDTVIALRSFAASSSGGIDGLRPGHLKDLIASPTAEAGRRALKSITSLVNRILSSDIPEHGSVLLFAANLTALRKKDGGIRPVAVGNVFRRLAVKIACRSSTKLLSEEFAPVQLGVGIRSGCESAAHAMREFINSRPTDSPAIVIKLDMKNALNSIRRDRILEICRTRAPSIFRMAHLSYNKPSSLLANGHPIDSCTGVQQGDPLGPALFALAVDEVARSITSPFNVWYLDDATIGGDLESVLADIQSALPALERLGLVVNPAKSEVINVGYSEIQFEESLRAVRRVLDGARVTSTDSVVLLGAPIQLRAIKDAINGRRVNLSQMIEKLSKLDHHHALFLLKNCFSAPKAASHSSFLYDLSRPRGIEKLSMRSFARVRRHITNCQFDDTGWLLAKMPVSLGGIGLRSASDLSLPAFLSSCHSSQRLVGTILGTDQVASSHHMESARETWNGSDLPCPPNPSTQKSWDHIRCQSALSAIRPSLSQHRLACLNAASCPGSGSWLNAIPASNLGTLLDDHSLSCGIATRLGLRICQEHRCRCGCTVDEFGLHVLSCRYSAGRIPRHVALNDIVKRALDSAGMYSVLEPVGLDRGDGKRPDGITVFPFKQGKSLAWDATCVDTFSSSALIASAINPGSAARAAEDRKRAKYAALHDHHFVPIAVETSGVIGPAALSLFKEIGRRIGLATGDTRQTEFLTQRISLAIIRGNAFSLLSSVRVNH